MPRRPLPIRLAPPRLRTWLYSRFYWRQHARYGALFDEAPLSFAPGTSMFGLRPGDVISGHIALTGQHEPEVSRTVRRFARQGGLLVDVGANMGYFSLLWAGAKPGNSAVAIEASPRVLPLLDRNITGNRLDQAIRVIPRAASDHAGKVGFALGPEEQTGWGGIGDGIEVDCFRLDAEFAGQRIDLLKIDVEGAETLVLRGAEGLLREKRVGQILFEHNPTREAALGLSFDDLKSWLESFGYRCFALGADEWRASAE